jgi:hypothetical protein
VHRACSSGDTGGGAEEKVEAEVELVEDDGNDDDDDDDELGADVGDGVNAMSSSSSAISFVGRSDGLASIWRSKNFPDVPVQYFGY